MCFKRFHISILKRQTLECRRKYWFVVVFFQVFWQIPTSGCPDGSGYIMVQFIQVGKPICLPFLKHFDESPSWFELLPTQRNKHSNQKTILRNGKKTYSQKPKLYSVHFLTFCPSRVDKTWQPCHQLTGTFCGSEGMEAGAGGEGEVGCGFGRRAESTGSLTGLSELRNMIITFSTMKA